MTPFSIFVGDEYLGDGLQTYPESIHYFCVKCGNIWGRVVSHDSSAQHWTRSGHCYSCGPGLWGPPIITEPLRFGALYFPTKALVRDFLYLMEIRDQIIHNNSPMNRHDDKQAAA